MRRADLAVESRKEVRGESCEFWDKETGLNLGGGVWDALAGIRGNPISNERGEW